MESSPKKKDKSPKIINMGQNKYKVLYTLGKGSQGKVYCVQREGTGQYFAMKVCKPSQESATQIMVHKNCNCQNIVSIIEANKVDDKIYIVLELGECNLQKYIEGKHNKRLDEQQLFRLIRDVGNGLSVIHKNNFIHHDIKLTNIIINFDTFKIADFGVSMKGEMKAFRGTPLYLAPECLQMKTKLGSFDSALDIWSLGVVVFQSCFDMHPLYTKSSNNMDYFKQQIELLTKNGYSFSAFKNALKKDDNPRKLKKFEDIQKQLKYKQVLEHFFNRVFTFQPTQRLKLQQIPMILSQVNMNSSHGQNHGMNSNNQHHQQIAPKFMSQPVLPSYDQVPFSSPTIQRLPSFGSNQTIQPQPFYAAKSQFDLQASMNGPVQLTQATLLQFFYNTVQIMKMTLGSYPSQLSMGVSAINDLIVSYQSGTSIQPKITQASLLSVYSRLGNLAIKIPGVFFRILFIAYLSQILRNYDVFILSMEMISNGEVKTKDFRQIEQYAAKIDYVRLGNVAQVLQQLK